MLLAEPVCWLSQCRDDQQRIWQKFNVSADQERKSEQHAGMPCGCCGPGPGPEFKVVVVQVVDIKILTLLMHTNAAKIVQSTTACSYCKVSPELLK